MIALSSFLFQILLLFSRSVVSDSVTPCAAARQAPQCFTISQSLLTHVQWVWATRVHWVEIIWPFLEALSNCPVIFNWKTRTHAFMPICSDIVFTVCRCCYSVTKSCPTLLDHWTAAHQALLSFTPPTVCSNSRPLSQWCHPTIFSFVIPFSSCLQSFPASGSFRMSQLFTSGGQSIGVSASASTLPMNIQGWFPLGWTGRISLQSKGLSRVFSSIRTYQFFDTQPSL